MSGTAGAAPIQFEVTGFNVNQPRSRVGEAEAGPSGASTEGEEGGPMDVFAELGLNKVFNYGLEKKISAEKGAGFAHHFRAKRKEDEDEEQDEWGRGRKGGRERPGEELLRVNKMRM
eukprot:3076626-Rhodomonas_salina.1